MAWDFLSSSRDLVGMVLPPTKRMIHALTPPTGKAVAIPTPSELAFSEACMLLTKILLVEVRDVLRRHMSKKLVDDVLAQRPVNLLTWPEVAGDALVALVNHRAHPEMRTSEMAALLSVRPSGWLASIIRCGDMVAILISRPLAAAFVRPVDPAQVPGYADVVSKPMDLENTDYWHAADSLALLTESLYESWVLQPERRRDAESMKEAGLGVVDAPTPAASSSAAAAAAPGVTTPATGAQVKQEEYTSPGTATAGETTAAAAGGVVVVKKEDEHPAVGAAGTDATGAAVPSTTQTAASRVEPGTRLSSSSPAAAAGTDANAASTAAAAGTTTGMDVDQSGTGDADANITAAAATAAVVATVKTEQQQDTPAGAAQEAAAAAARLSPNADGSTSSGGKNSSNSVEANGAASTAGTNGGCVQKPDEEAGQQRGNGGTAPAITTTTAPPAARAPAPAGISRSTSTGGRPERLPLDPASVHPAFAGRRPLSRHESPASGRSYGLWDPAAVHPVYFGHLRHDGEASGAAGLDGWTGAGDGGAIDRALRVLRGAADSEVAAAVVAGGAGKEVAGVVRWSAEERATVLGLLCDEVSATGVAVDHMKVGGGDGRNANCR
ncbi:unnamed protein product [Ectocarpus sp. CCAP 1310/34]|nr:unnamed protein product [Ectocarpus sp. CCAP 1310/34]